MTTKPVQLYVTENGFSDTDREGVQDLGRVAYFRNYINQMLLVPGAKQRGLDEVFRVLRPGGRFLMAVWTPGWTMFAVANVFSFFLTPKSRWREMAAHAGFNAVDEGVFNGAWFLLMEKPADAAAAA